ncbi:MAG: cytochrome c3 family protein [Deltaproteobacteria bacterium]|nr:cytochrome c3 family protein [Deltaproteobacteria bacterium]
MGSDRLPAIVLLAAVLFLSSCGRGEKAFRHDGHLTITKGACAPCHGGDPSRPRPAATADCAACHRQAEDPAKAGRYGLPGGTSRRPPMRYEGVVFQHAPHAEAGTPCTACHGTGEKPGFPTTSACSGCHEREGGPKISPPATR